ncbi:MAG TPA: helix-turn-helix domain-containing protein [Gemmatimonadota bacterium]|nr:helix-turn-helix domain-containing protein [Gemmatimonadota bacterium]
MSPRPYRLGRRQEGVDKTRDRILDAARTLLKGDGYAEFTVDTVAREADVSRATVYYQFGSKAGLLEALFDDLAVRGRMTDLADAFQEADPLAALDRFIGVVTRFYASDRILLRRLRGLAAMDPDFASGIRGRDERRRKGLAALLGRLAERHGRPAGDDLVRALDVLHTLTSFEAFDNLSRRGRKAEDIGEIVADLGRAELGLAPRPGRSKRRPG